MEAPYRFGVARTSVATQTYVIRIPRIWNSSTATVKPTPVPVLLYTDRGFTSPSEIIGEECIEVSYS